MAKIDPKVERLALSLASKTNDMRISSRKAPAGLAAAYVYISSVMLDEHISQRKITEDGGTRRDALGLNRPM